MGDAHMTDVMLKDGLTDAFYDIHMGITAENICEQWGLTREELDDFAAKSQQKAVAAVKSGRFKDEIVPVEITGAVAGSAGSPGELKGRFLTSVPTGTITVNGETGVYGRGKSYMKGIEAEVALAQEVNTGDAEIITTIEGQEPKRYTAVIEKIALSSDNPNRNMVVRVTDPRLLTATGGIVQGMSGSPILQDGRLVGAVTHVLVNDPTRGSGIFAENMVQSADAAAQREAA